MKRSRQELTGSTFNTGSATRHNDLAVQFSELAHLHKELLSQYVTVDSKGKSHLDFKDSAAVRYICEIPVLVVLVIIKI